MNPVAFVKRWARTSCRRPGDLEGSRFITWQLCKLAAGGSRELRHSGRTRLEEAPIQKGP
jgi:hypothetical protein